MPSICGRRILTHVYVMRQIPAVKHVRRRKGEVVKRLVEAEQTLAILAVPAEGYPGHNDQFFEDHWIAQRTQQLDGMTDTQKQKREKLTILLAMEEQLVIAREELRDLQNKTRRARTQADRNELLSLPGSIVDIEGQIEAMATALGGAEFRALTAATGNQANAALSISLARDKLYESKVGLVECRLRRHRDTDKHNIILASMVRKHAIYATSTTPTNAECSSLEPIIDEGHGLNSQGLTL
ncbi:uncharacterized protein MELLADRAFT_86338 [Melampsora larici-populina 98AG31]|uniref:Uncharacterized protein n=1 Tax=Melampsora larici-populina (strain 98AG31 / pathotype 3-4-7) TaxID=747676 RepID=F4SDN0_MELLP|nr:uncharacterized protein MELLADRAFT_86338 [Melampsora larici-populina 98AG31]EGF97249.1 hypothetical protein MELLADRAFT_86338 [Melampsora larici-populina 98AG31]